MTQGRIRAIKKERIKKSDLLFYCSMLVIPILNLIVFYFYGNANSFLLAVKAYDIDKAEFYFSGFAVFKTVFADLGSTLILRAFGNSLLVYAVGLFIITPLSLLFSYYIFKKFPFSNAMRVIFFLPSLIAGIILIVIFKYFVTVTIPEMLGKVGITIERPLGNPNTALPIILFYSVIVGFGGNILIYSGSMNSVNTAVIESARLDGVNPLQEMTRIVLPLMWPTFTTFVVTGLAGLFTNQMYLYDLYGINADYSLYTIGYYTFSKTASGVFSEYPYLSAFGLVLTAITIPLTFLVRWAMTRFGPSVD